MEAAARLSGGAKELGEGAKTCCFYLFILVLLKVFLGFLVVLLGFL